MYQVIRRTKNENEILYQAFTKEDAFKYVVRFLKRNCHDLEYQAGFIKAFLEKGRITFWGKTYLIKKVGCSIAKA